MNAYVLVLFLHVLGAIGLFVGLVLEGFVLARLRSADSAEQVRFFARAIGRLKVVYIPSFVGALLGGIYLGSVVGSAATLWIAVSLGAFVILMLIGGLVTGIQMARLDAMLKAETVDFSAVKARANTKALLAAYGVRAGIALGILFLMTTKPDLILSLVAVAAGAFLGLTLALMPRQLTCTFPQQVTGGAK